MTAKIDEELGSFAQNILEVLSKETKESDEKIDKLWTDSEKKELAELFGGKKKKNVPNSGFKHILNLFEIEKSEQGLLLLCRIVDAILWVFASENDRKKEKAIVKFDAIAVFSRILRRRLILRIETASNSNSEIMMNLEIDRILYKLLLNIGLKDARFNLKIRMAGIVQIMCRMFMKFDELLDCFYPLFIRIARSPRSGQMIGRQEGFVKKLTDKIWYLNGLENAENIHLLDKHLQILFFVLKNRRVRVQIIRDSYCRTLLEILEKHLKGCSPKPARRLLSSIFGTTDESTNLAISAHIEVIVTNLAILRLLANNKKARDELISLGTLQICAKKLKSMSDEDGKNGMKSKMMASFFFGAGLIKKNKNFIGG
ncbi:unnamed protein product [Caenorhabditis angaria]|uniref:Uncharacterized protein n=1 Tax=Caenorhabditis angaria TaxID=860376 RepID=A0A9P1MXG2_9PELO|nr:unnamed protein product [Caenorhabditis angaria]